MAARKQGGVVRVGKGGKTDVVSGPTKSRQYGSHEKHPSTVKTESTGTTAGDSKPKAADKPAAKETKGDE